MPKTITINDNGNVTQTGGTLTDEEKLSVGNFLFDTQETDDDGQFLFYTGIFEEEEDDEENVDEDEEDNG